MIFINRLIIENVRIISPEEQRDEIANLYINNGRIADPFRKTEQVTVIDNTTYKNIDGYDWYRIIIPDGRQAFIPGKYLK